MDFAELSNAAKAAVGLTAIYIFYYILASFSLWQRRRSMKREKGVMEVPRTPQWDRIYGLDLFMTNMKALKNHCILEFQHRRFENLGFNTTQQVVFGRVVHNTREPENLKTIQAIDHKKWGLGSRRKNGFLPLLGTGASDIFQGRRLQFTDMSRRYLHH